MRSILKVISLFVLIFVVSCGSKIDKNILSQFPESRMVTVQNSSDLARTDETIALEVEKLTSKAPEFNPQAFIIVDENLELASQADDVNGDGKMKAIHVLANFKAHETKQLQIRYAKAGVIKRDYPQRTQAELSVKVGGKFENRKYIGGTFQNVQSLHVPPEHTDHSFYIRYEGPGWESDKVGYRFYLDWRNAIDVYGKKTPAMVLQNVGQDGFDSYHEMSDWGMDILKVGDALGIGSIAMWVDGNAQRVSVTDSVFSRILANGPVESQIETKYFGWKVGGGTYNLTSNLSITAGSRLTKHELTITGEPPNLCTGIVKLDSTEVIQSPTSNSDWLYLATYGKQSLANDSLGMAVIFKKADLIEVTADELSHVVVLKPAHNFLEYYFLSAWEKEPGGIVNKEAFVNYLNETVQRLANPVSVAF